MVHQGNSGSHGMRPLAAGLQRVKAWMAAMMVQSMNTIVIYFSAGRGSPTLSEKLW